MEHKLQVMFTSVRKISQMFAKIKKHLQTFVNKCELTTSGMIKNNFESLEFIVENTTRSTCQY